MLLTFISFVLLLGILVLVHEFGHFLAAKKSGVLVEEFGFGFPPRLFGIRRGETLYSINLIPLGGFVKVFGEEYGETEKQPLSPEQKNRTFVYKKPWQKTLIISAGVIGNFLLAWVIISYLFTQGVSVPETRVIIESVQHTSPAESAGLKKKDIIYGLEKDAKIIQITTPQQLIEYTDIYAAQEITLLVKREKKELRIKIMPRKNPPKGQGPLGVAINPFIEKFSEKKYVWYQAPFYGLLEAFSITKTISSELLKMLFRFITFQKVSVEVTGPIGIAQFAGEAAKRGINTFLELTSLLSLNLAVINIFPFPALDGGRLIFVFYEWFTKKRINQKIERNLNLLGIVILLSLAALISVNDIIKIYR